MDKSEKIEQLKEMVERIAAENGAYLVDLALKSEGKRDLVQVFCETDTGITIDKCAEISRDVQQVLTGVSFLKDNYRLEVSSPGVGSVIKVKRQYRRNIGQLLEVRYRIGDLVQNVEGTLVIADEDEIGIDDGKQLMKIRYDDIIYAKVKIRW
ncbi:MAG: ribosome maturation factor RimP [Candidatus Kryptoniota bacterium]